MPYQVANTFSPMTPWGEGIQNITRALFSGPTPMEQERMAADAEQRRMHSELYRAQIDEKRAKTAAAQRAEADMAGAPMRLAAAFLGSEPVAKDYMAYRRGDKTDQYRGSDGGDGPVTEMAPAPMPQGLDPNSLARLNRSLAGVEIAKAVPGNDNAGHLAKIVEALYNDDIRQRAISGQLTAGQATDVGRASAAVAGKPIFNNLGNDGVFDLFGGAQTLNPIGNAEVALKGAKVKTEGAHAGAYSAAADASRARAADERRQTELRGGMTDWTDPATGVTYKVPMTTLATERIRVDGRKDVQDNKDANKPEVSAKAGAPGKPRPLTKNDTTLMRSEVDALLSSLDAEDADEQTKRAIVAEAERQWQAGAAGHAVAVKAAVDKIAPEGFQRGGMIGFRKSKPAGGARSSGQITTAPAAQAEVPPPQARVKNQVYQTPRGPMKWTGTGWVPAAPGVDS